MIANRYYFQKDNLPIFAGYNHLFVDLGLYEENIKEPLKDL